MPRTYTKEASGTQLVTGVLASVDIPSMAMRAWQLGADVEEAKKLGADLDAFIAAIPANQAKGWDVLAKSTIDQLVSKSAPLLTGYMAEIQRIQRSQLVYSSLGWGLSSGIIGQKIKFLASINGLDVWHDAIIGLPQQMAIEKLERYWRKQAAPDLPSDRDAFMLWRLGKWTKGDYTNRLREIEGISLQDAENIATIREQQTGKPSLKDAYLMVQKGLKPKAFFDNIAIHGHGFTKEDADNLYLHMSYDPSPSEMLRLSDLIPLDSAWIEKKLKAVGLDFEDKEIFKAGIEKRQIRDEVNKAWGVLLDCYQWGLFAETDIRSLLENWKFGKTEQDIRVQTGELLKTKLRVKLLRDAEIYLYRKGIIAEITLLIRLAALGIAKDVANAIVRNEAAKKGIDWEIAIEELLEVGTSTEFA